MEEEPPNNILIKDTAVVLEGVAISDEWMEYKNLIDFLQAKVCALFQKMCDDGLVNEINDKYVRFNQDVWSGKFEGMRPNKEKYPEGIYPKNELSLRHFKFQPQFQEIIFNHLNIKSLKEVDTSVLDAHVWYVIERFKSYVKRNKKNAKKISLQGNKATYFKDGEIKIDINKKTFTINTIWPKFLIEMSYEFSKWKNEKDSHDKKCGGNLKYYSLQQRVDNKLVLRSNKIINFPEEVKVVVGTDFNYKPSDWIHFSKEISDDGSKKIIKPKEVTKAEEVKDFYNNALGKGRKRGKRKKEAVSRIYQKDGVRIEYKLNSKQRKKKERTLHNKQQKFKAAIAVFLEPKLEYLKKTHEGLGIAIDDVHTGGKGMAFGQEYISEVIQEWCEKNNTPYRIVPPAYTSQRCPKCGSFHSQDRKTTNVYLCASCGYFNDNCDNLGAMTNEIFGEFLFKKFKVSGVKNSQSQNFYKNSKGKRCSFGALYSEALSQEFNFPK